MKSRFEQEKKLKCSKCKKYLLRKEVGMIMFEGSFPPVKEVYYCSSCAGEIRKLIEKS